MRRTVSHLLVIALLVVVALVASRPLWGSSYDEVALERLRPEALAHTAFVLDAPSRVAVAAGGSARAPGDTARAAYAWIVPREAGAPVWQQPAGRSPRGTYYAIADTLALPAGTYDVYFAAIADRDAPPAPPGLGRLVGLARPVWHGDAGRWHVRVRAVGGALRRAPAAAPAEGTFWHAASQRDADKDFAVSAPATLRAEALLDGAADLAFVLDLASGDTVWAFRPAASAHAGGAARNRRAQATLTLAPGVYRAAARPARAHGPGRWQGPPPYQPARWGLRLVAGTPADRAHIHGLDDPDAPQTRLAGWDCVGPSEQREARVTVERMLPVRVVSTGEFIDDSAYDYATLARVLPGGGEELLWRQTREGSEHAGGERKNRRSTFATTLPPGEYRLRYVTDGSWDCSDFGSRGPTDGVWGAALYTIGRGEPAGVRVEADADTPALAEGLGDPAPGSGAGSQTNVQAGVAAEDESFEGAAAPRGELLVDLTRVGNQASVADNFLLDRPRTIRIIAVGELLPGEALDYAEIASVGRPESVVWRMARENTRPAGGAAKNRVFDGTLDLPAGEYVVRYRTNATHAYGSFDAPPPPGAWRWGVRIWHD